MNFSLGVDKYRYDYLAECGSATDTVARLDTFRDISPVGQATCLDFAQYKPELVNEIVINFYLFVCVCFVL